MEKLTSCPLCGEINFIPFLQSNDFFLTQEEYTIVSCSSCGMKFVNPRPEPGEIGKYYESPEYVSHDTGKKNSLNFLYKRLRKISIERKYNLVKKHARGKKLLDVGCGTGEFLFFCEKKGFKVTGIEPGEKPRSFAQLEYKLNVEAEGYLDQMVPQQFDVITMWHVLEHIHPLHERIDIILDIMKHDGTLIIAVPNCDSWDARYYGKFWAAYDLPRHLYHFSQETMKTLAQKHKLIIDEIIPMKLDAFYISLLSEKYSRGKQNFFRAFVNGVRSNSFANKSNNNYSSLIYVMKRGKWLQ
ncbi:MAG: class I SAM-dependent methyltransferase [Bacteroidetes bacterium]|nr:class I SAM-dependent methyltransferase [Bacteroidota bacterium]